MTDEYFPQHVVYCGEECVVSRQQLLKEASSAISAIEANMNAPARSASSSPSPLPVLRSSKGEYVPEPTSNVYTGALGVAHMHWTLFKHTHGNSLHPAGAGEAHAKRALALLAQCGEEAALHRSLERDVSLRGGMAYYMGDAGLHTLGCALHAGTPWGSAKLAGKHARALIRIAQAAAVPGACHGVREVLYGQAGLLYCLRAVADTVGMPLSGEAATLGAAVAQSICSAGIDPCGVAQTTGEDAWPMMWQFGRSEYLGAAHGVVGIAYMLLDWVPELLPEHRQRLVALVTRITELCLTSESLPVAASLRFDTALFHWCHGTPGAILLLVKAFQIFGTPQFLDAARCAAGVLWQRGMLRKGSGLCHGIHGNAYAFLALYRATGEEQYVFCAKSFHAASLSGPYLAAVQSYTDEQRDVQNIPDSPYSLMEGAAGVVCFLYDLLAPLRSAFPGFETPPRFDCRFQPQGLPAPVFAFTTSKVRPLLPGSIWEVDALDAASCESLAALAESTVTAEELAARGIKLAETTFHSVLAQCKSLVLRVLEENAQMPPRAVTPSRAVQHPTFFDQLKGKLLKVKEPPPAAASAAPPPLFDLASADGAPRLSFVAAYVVRYDSVHHPRIHSHRDACDVTLNVCLRKTCAMSSLYFDDARLSYQHVPGKAVVHWGKLMHHTKRLQGEGSRSQLVALYNIKGLGRTAGRTGTGQVLAGALSDVVLAYIFSFLSFPDLARCMHTCRRLHTVLADDDFWCKRFREVCQRYMDVPSVEDLAARAETAICAKCLSPTNRCGLVQCDACKQFTHRQDLAKGGVCLLPAIAVPDALQLRCSFRCHACGGRDPVPTHMHHLLPVDIAQSGWKNCVRVATTTFCALSFATGSFPPDADSWAATSSMATGSSYTGHQRIMTGLYMPGDDGDDDDLS